MFDIDEDNGQPTFPPESLGVNKKGENSTESSPLFLWAHPGLNQGSPDYEY
jgi:hypothetical protein